MEMEFDRIPRFQAVPPVTAPRPRIAARHVVAALLAGASALPVYAAASAPAPKGVGAWLLLAGLAAAAGIVLASYLPGRSRGPALTPCGRMAALHPFLAVVPLSQGAPVLAVFLLGFALFQRFSSGSCAV